MPKKKKPKISTLDKKLWQLFSQFIRTRDCISTTGSAGMGACISCSAIYHFKSLDAGHYIPRKIQNIKYDERNVNAQCIYCNQGLGGNTPEYQINLDIKYGEGTTQELLELQRKYRAGDYEKHGIDWYREKIEEYKEKIEALKPKEQYTIEDLPF